MNDQNRRDFFKKIAIGGAVLLAGPRVFAAGETPDDKKIFNKYFRVEVAGIYGEVPGVVSIDPGRVTVRTEETTQGDKPNYRTYTYGQHKYDDLTMTVQQSPDSKKLHEWADKAMKTGGSASALRRDISIYLLGRDKKTVLRTINCYGCFPINMNAGDHSTGSDIKTITITCNVSRIEVA